MKIIESNKFRERGVEADKLLSSDVQLEDELKKMLEIRREQAKVHEAIEQKAGIKLTVVQEGEPEDAAAFVEHDAINSGLHQAFIVEGVLGNPDQAMHAAKHEAMHIQSGFTAIELTKELNDDQLQILLSTLGIVEDDETFWLEGYNELATIQKIGKDPNCGYNDKEVPAAQKLEQLCFQHMGESLIPAYKNGNKQLFYDRLRNLCDNLLVENIRKTLKMAG